jgi:hypothetical protein
MKALMCAVICFASLSASASTIQTVCGVNKANGEKIRLSVVLTAEDEFSAPVVEAIDGQAPHRSEENAAYGFGPHGYEYITMDLDGCSGTAVYSHYNSAMPMNPMENLTLKCICK